MADVFTRLAHFRDFLLEKTQAIAERAFDAASRAARVLGRRDTDAEEADSINRDTENAGRRDLRDAERETRRQLKQSARWRGERVPASLGEKALGAAERAEKKIERVGRVRGLLSRINWGTLASTVTGWLAAVALIAVGYHYSPQPEKGEPPQPKTVNLQMPNLPPLPDIHAMEEEFNKSSAEMEKSRAQTQKMVNELTEYIRWRDGLAEEIRLSGERLKRMEAALAPTLPRAALAPRPAFVLPPAVRVVAARAVVVTVAEPNRAPRTYEQTVGGVVAAAPEDLRETVGRSITEECHVCGNRTLTFSSFGGTTISISGFR